MSDMAKYSPIIALIVTFTQLSDVSAMAVEPPIKKNTTEYLTYNDLYYILQSRLGVAAPKPKHLTPCARAILGCCSDKVMNEFCSEVLGCGSYFFDDNPCEDKFIIDALHAAKAFYSQK